MISASRKEFKGKVNPYFPHFLLDGADICARIDLKNVDTKHGERVDIFEGTVVKVVEAGRRSDQEVAVEWGGKIVYVPVMVNGKRTLGIANPDTSKIFGGRRLRKAQLACQTDNLQQLLKTSKKIDPFYKFWHPKFNVNGVDELGMTPFLSACAYGSFDVIEHLIRDGNADLARRDHFGRSALHLLCLGSGSIRAKATFVRRVETIEYLVLQGLDVKQRCAMGKIPADYVHDVCHKELDMTSQLLDALEGKLHKGPRSRNNLQAAMQIWNSTNDPTPSSVLSCEQNAPTNGRSIIEESIPMICSPRQRGQLRRGASQPRSRRVENGNDNSRNENNPFHDDVAKV